MPASKSHKIYVQKQIQRNYKFKYQVTDHFLFYCWIKQGSLLLLKQTVDIIQPSIILFLCENQTTSLFYNIKQEGNAFYLRELANLFYTSRTYNNSDYKCFNAVVSLKVMYVEWALILNCSNCFTLFNMSKPTVPLWWNSRRVSEISMLRDFHLCFVYSAARYSLIKMRCSRLQTDAVLYSQAQWSEEHPNNPPIFRTVLSSKHVLFIAIYLGTHYNS